MFVDELTIEAKAGNGGDGVVRWRHEKFRPLAGPSGGDGGKGGDVYVKGVKDLNQLAKYTGAKRFDAENGAHGQKNSLDGKRGADLYIDVPVGSTVTDINRRRQVEISEEGQIVKILSGGNGGYGNEHFKSSTNQAPEEATPGQRGEEGTFLIEVSLVVDVGLVGLPNAGKSTLLNLITNARSRIGAYPFTTLEPHLGSLYGYIIADIPGLIAGAASGKGLGHKFLRHVSRTKMLLHLVSLEEGEVKNSYQTIFNELNQYHKSLTDKESWIVLTKKDLVKQEDIDKACKALEKFEKRVFVISENDPDSVKKLQDTLVAHLRDTYNG